MVGDCVDNDVGAGLAAGTWTAFLDTHTPSVPSTNLGLQADSHKPAAPKKATVDRTIVTPHLVINTLIDLPRRVLEIFDIAGPLGTGVPLMKFTVPKATTEACIAAQRGDAAAVIKAAGSAIDCRDKSGNTPLIWAADSGNRECVATLVAAGANVNARGFIGATAISRAARNGDVAVLSELLAAPFADPNIPNDKMQTPLHYAAYKQHHEAVRMLLAAGASTLTLDRKGRTPAEDTANAAIRADILSARVVALA